MDFFYLGRIIYKCHFEWINTGTISKSSTETKFTL